MLLYEIFDIVLMTTNLIPHVNPCIVTLNICCLSDNINNDNIMIKNQHIIRIFVVLNID